MSDTEGIVQYQTPRATSLFKNEKTRIADIPTEVVIAPPALYLLPTLELLHGEGRKTKDRKAIEVAAQNVFDRPNGAFTGEISAEQLRDIGVTWTLVGHSERRVVLGEDDAVR